MKMKKVYFVLLFICGISGYAQQLKINYKDSAASVNRRTQRTEESSGINVNRSMYATSLNKRDSLRSLREKQPTVNDQHSSANSLRIVRRATVDSTNKAPDSNNKK